MEQVSLTAQVREKAGSRVSRRLLREGKIPAVLYGHKTDGIMLTLDSSTMEKLMGPAGYNGLVNLEIKERPSKSPLLVLIKDFQADLLTRRLTHVDLFKVDLREKVTVSVPIRVEGTAPGVKAGGILEIVRRELEVRCLPTSIPESIAVDISRLGIGDSVHIRDIICPEGVEFKADKEFTVISVAVPAKAEEEAPPAAEAAAAEAGALAEGAQPATPEKEGDKTGDKTAEKKGPDKKEKKE